MSIPELVIWAILWAAGKIIWAILCAIGQVVVWLAKTMVANVVNFLVGLNIILFCLVLLVDWIK